MRFFVAQLRTKNIDDIRYKIGRVKTFFISRSAKTSITHSYYNNSNALYMFIALIGFLSATLSSMLGVGGGALMVPLLLFFYKNDHRHAVVICLASLIPSFIIALLRNPTTTEVSIKILLIATCGTCLGAVFGTYISQIIPIEIFKKILAFILLMTASQLIFSS